jgi:8-oxo-dGTP diphosphatase
VPWTAPAALAAVVDYEPAGPERPLDMHHGVFLCVTEDPAALPRPDGRLDSPPPGPPHPDAVEITACGSWSADDLPRPISDFTVRRIRDALSAAHRYPLPATVGPRRWLE